MSSVLAYATLQRAKISKWSSQMFESRAQRRRLAGDVANDQ